MPSILPQEKNCSVLTGFNSYRTKSQVLVGIQIIQILSNNVCISCFLGPTVPRIPKRRMGNQHTNKLFQHQCSWKLPFQLLDLPETTNCNNPPSLASTCSPQLESNSIIRVPQKILKGQPLFSEPATSSWWLSLHQSHLGG